MPHDTILGHHMNADVIGLSAQVSHRVNTRNKSQQIKLSLRRADIPYATSALGLQRAVYRWRTKCPSLLGHAEHKRCVMEAEFFLHAVGCNSTIGGKSKGGEVFFFLPVNLRVTCF